MVKSLAEGQLPEDFVRDKISVIVPVYNVEPYIRRCIDSILTQTYSDLQVILVDDGSTDGSGDVCDEYSRADHRIVVLHKRNGGLSSARNAGLDVATGEYIGFVDSDDYIESDMYGMLHEGMKAEDCDMVMCGIRAVKGDVTSSYIPQSTRKLLTASETLEAILTRSYMCFAVWNRLYKKSIFHDLRFPEGKIHEDFYVAAKICARCKSVLYCPEEKYYYCLRQSGSIISTVSRTPSLDIVAASQQLIDDIQESFPELSNKTIVYCLLQVWNFVSFENSSRQTEFIDHARRLFHKNWRYIYHSTRIVGKQKALMIAFALSYPLSAFLHKYGTKWKIAQDIATA